MLLGIETPTLVLKMCTTDAKSRLSLIETEWNAPCSDQKPPISTGSDLMEKLQLSLRLSQAVPWRGL